MRKILMVLLLMGMLIGASGCSGLMPTWKYPCIGGTWLEREDERRKTDNPYTRYVQKKEQTKLTNRQKYLDSHPRISEHIKKWIEEGWAALGMTTEQVIAAKGQPNDKNYTTGSWGIHEQWVYGGYDKVTGFYSRASYFYFENGTLTSRQY